MKKPLIFLFGFLTVFSLVKAQDSVKSESVHQVGLNFGFCSGTGLTYRYWPGKFGIQVAVFGFKTDPENGLTYSEDDNGINSETKRDTLYQYLSIGLTGICTLKQFHSYKLAGYIGNHFLIIDKRKLYNAGAGIGISTNAKISVHFFVGYGVYDILKDIKLLPTVEIGAVYRIPRKSTR